MNDFTSSPSPSLPCLLFLLFLLSHSRSHRSVPLPPLTPAALAAWPAFSRVISELDDRDLLHSSLRRCPFGSFPFQPSIDAQMCSQLQNHAREEMEERLREKEEEMEAYARESERECDVIREMLGPVFGE